MAFNYGRVANSALRLLTKFGQPVTLTQKTPGVYNPETGEVAVVDAAQSATGVVLDYGTKSIDGALIMVGDRKLLLSPVGIDTPAVNDVVSIGEVTYTITLIKETNPAGTPVLYECNIRP